MKDKYKIHFIALLIGFAIFEVFFLFAGVLFTYQMHVRAYIMVIGMIAFPIAILYTVKRK